MHATSRDTQVPRARIFPRVYEDVPYLVTRIVPTLSHIIPLPDSLDDSSLRSLARYQHQRNQLPTCLVLGARSCIYFDGHGTETASDTVPSGGIVVSEHLKPCTPLEHTPWWDGKMTRLRAFVEGQRPAGRTGYLLGDLTKGGRHATAEELLLFAGMNPDGIPTGLSRCSVCAEWKGTCLDPAPQFHEQLMRVACRCDNDNRCARCHDLLAERKLNANYYCEADGRIWHTPGFVGLGHQCPAQHIVSENSQPQQ
jgi:hypothetical protein